MKRIRLGYLHSLELITIKLYYVSSQFEVVFKKKQTNRSDVLHSRGNNSPWIGKVQCLTSSGALFPIDLGARMRFLFLFFPFIFISWRLITLQYYSGFCHTLTWINRGFTRVAHPVWSFSVPVTAEFLSKLTFSVSLKHCTW